MFDKNRIITEHSLGENYLMLQCHKDEYPDRIAINVIRNDPPGFLLPMKAINMNNYVEIRYAVGSQKPLKHENLVMNKKQFLKLYDSFLTPFIECSDWMLDYHCLCIDADYVFVNNNEQSVDYMYLPIMSCRSTDSEILEFFEDILSHLTITNGKDLMRKMLQSFNAGDISLVKLNQMIQEEMGNGTQSGRRADLQGGFHLFGRKGEAGAKSKKAGIFGSRKKGNDEPASQKKEEPQPRMDYVMPQREGVQFQREYTMPPRETPQYQREYEMPQSGPMQGETEYMMPPRRQPQPQMEYTMPPREEPQFQREYEMPQGGPMQGETEYMMPPRGQPQPRREYAMPQRGQFQPQRNYMPQQEAQDDYISDEGRNDYTQLLFGNENENEKTEYSHTPMQTSKSYLVFMNGNIQGVPGRIELSFAGDSIIIGRQSKDPKQPDVAFGSEYKKVGRMHVCIRRENGKYYVIDLGSRNATLLNDRILTPNQPYLLHDQDVIGIVATSPFRYKVVLAGEGNAR